MTRSELEAALAWADWLARSKDPGPALAMAKVTAPALACALREAWAEIDRMKLSWDSAEAQIDDVDDELRDVVKENAALRKKLHEAGINPSLDEALNSGDGSYKP